MVKHIVFWKLKDSANGRTREGNAAFIKSSLEGLLGVIPGLLHIEVGVDFSGTESSAHLALYSEFESRDALDAYQRHPAHKAVMPFIFEARSERRIVDYEV
jgi:stress responsive alpha/beta barrel protein